MRGENVNEKLLLFVMFLISLYLEDGIKIEGIYKNDEIGGSVKFFLPNGINFEIPYINFQ